MSDAPIRLLTNHGRCILLLATTLLYEFETLQGRSKSRSGGAKTVVTGLVEAGYVARTRVWRRIVYKVDGSRAMGFVADAVTIESILAASGQT